MSGNIDIKINQAVYRLSEQAFWNLKDYLLVHESDISWRIEDYGELATLFKELFNRDPRE